MKDIFTLNASVPNATSVGDRDSSLSLGAFRLTAAFGGGLLNFTLLLMLAVNQKLCTAFNIYLIFILGFNTILAVLVYPMRAFHHILDLAWSLRTFSCGMYLYFSWTSIGVLLKLHSLITVNRVWAVTFPISYRSLHGPKMAQALCLCACFVEGAFFLPGFALTFVYLPLTENSCAMRVRLLPTWTYFYVFGSHLLPLSVITLGYFFMLKRYVRTERTSSNVSKGQSSENIPEKAKAFKQNISGSEEEARNMSRETVRHRSIAILTVSSVCAYLSCMPLVVLDFLQLEKGYQEDNTFRAMRTVFSTCQPILDPVLLLAGLSDLRQAYFHKIRQIVVRLRKVFYD